MGVDARMIAHWKSVPNDKGIISELFRVMGYESEFEWIDDLTLASELDMDRYYGPEYERGMNYPKHCGLMMALIASGAEVFYGGDCGDRLPHYTLDTVVKLMEYYMQYASRHYRDESAPALDLEYGPIAPQEFRADD